MKALCTLCGKPTKLDADKAHGLPVRHAECHAKRIAPIEKAREEARRREIDASTRSC